MLANAPQAEVIQFTPARNDARKQMVADLRQRYLNGTLDEVLVPEDADVPDTLLQALFPNLFGAPPVSG